MAKFDIFIIIFSTLTLFISLYFSFDESFISKMDKNTQVKLVPTAKVLKTVSSVKRKYKHSLTWYGLTSPNAAFEGDSIFTEEEASAELMFKNGIKLYIGPSTMLTLQSDAAEKSNIKIEKGSVSSQINKGQTLKIETAGGGEKNTQEISGDKSFLQLNVGEKGKTEIAVLAGEVKIGKGKKQSIIQKNQLAKIDNKGILEELKTMSLFLKYPENNQTFTYTGEKLIIPFRWEALKNFSSYTFKLSFDNSFKKILKESQYTSKSVSLDLSNVKNRGVFYWKIIGENSKEGNDREESISGVFYIINQKELHLFYPEDKSEFIVQEGKSIDLNFSWEEGQSTSNYKMTLSTDPLLNMGRKFTTDQTIIRIKNLKKGQYYWTVSSFSKNQIISSKGQVATFLIKEETPIKKEIPLINDKELSFSKTEEGVMLKWRERQDVKNYALQIALGKILTDKIPEKRLEKTIKENFYLLKTKQTGVFSWRVAPIADNGKRSPWSKTQNFSIEPPVVEKTLLPPSPKTVEKQEKWAVGRPVMIQWEPIENATSYEWQISKTKSFSDTLIKENIDKNELSFTPQSGTDFYYFRVKSKSNKAHFKESEFSIILSFSIIQSISPPEFTPKFSMPFKTKKEAILIWKKVPSAKSYLIQVSKDEKFTSPEEDERSDTNYKIPFDDPDILYIRGRSLGENKEVGRWSESLKVELLSPPLPPPQVVYFKEVDPPYFIWEKEKLAKKYHVQIVKIEKGQSLSIYDKEQDERFIKLENYKTGNYSWRVASIGNRNVHGQWSEKQSFTIKNILAMSVCQNKLKAEDLKNFDLDKISIDSETNCLIVRTTGEQL